MNHNYANFFNDGIKQMMNPENFTKFCSNGTNFDFTKFSNNLKHNAEALQEASQVAAESAQAIARRGAEILQSNATNIFNAMKDIASSSNVEQAMARQQELVQNLVKEAVSNTKEVFDTVSKSTTEVLSKMSKHAHEHMDSCCPMPDSKKTSGKK